MEFNDRQALKGISRYRNKALEYMKDRKKTTELLKQATKKTTKEHGRIGTFKNQLSLLIDLYYDWHSGKYRNIPYKTLTMVSIGILYFVVPTDMIPDILLGAGLVDDAAVLAYIFKQIGRDLAEYKQWKEQQLIHSIDDE